MSSLKYLVLFITTFKTIDGLRETIYFWQKGATYALTCTHTQTLQYANCVKVLMHMHMHVLQMYTQPLALATH